MVTAGSQALKPGLFPLIRSKIERSWSGLKSVVNQMTDWNEAPYASGFGIRDGDLNGGGHTV